MRDSPAPLRASRRAARSQGISIIETLVALTLAAVIMTAIIFSLNGALKTNRVIKSSEQATLLGSQEIEAARNLAYNQLAMSSSDIVGDTNIGATTSWAPFGTLAPTVGGDKEAIVAVAAQAGIPTHVSTKTLQGETYTIKKYVTQVDKSATDLGTLGVNGTRRLTVVVTWNENGTNHKARTSGLIAPQRRGLPEPKFEVTPKVGSAQTSNGARAVLAHTVRNLGITDTYDVVLPSIGGIRCTASADTEADGLYDAADDLPLVDTNANGLVDTGDVPTDGASTVFAVCPIPSSGSPIVGSTVTVKTIFRSGAHSTVSQSATDDVTIGFAALQLTLFNALPVTSAQTSTALQGTAASPMPLDPAVPAAPSTLASFGLGQPVVGPGRPLYSPASGGPATFVTPPGPYAARWSYTVNGISTATFYRGTYLWLYVANPGTFDCGEQVDDVRLRLTRVSATTGTTQLAEKVTTLYPSSNVDAATGRCKFSTGGYILLDVGANFTARVNDRIQLTITVEDPDRQTRPLLLGYGVDEDNDLGVTYRSFLYLFQAS